ncbi:MAG: PD40 domain-containing protein [Deltaproteobacteria bacterium]|nr:PD40 domain-containing protein [Deltaproteobacteria bacterium]
MQPFFSPDGKWIGYFSPSDQQLKKISINGGASVALAKTGVVVGPSRGKDGTILYGTMAGGGIMKISAQGGIPENLVEVESGGSRFPQILPDGRSVLFTRYENTFRIMAQSLESDEQKELFPGDGARYLPSGHLVYTVGNDLFAVPFDPEKLEVTGNHIPLVEGIFRSIGVSQFAVSDSGTLVFIPGSSDAAWGRKLVWVNREGREETIAAEPKDYGYPKISPDGTKLALTVNESNNVDIWTWDILRENQTRLTFHESDDLQSIWTPDSKRIIFWSGRDGGGLYWKSADGTGKAELLISSPELSLYPWSWSTEEDKLVLQLMKSAGEWDIGTLSMKGDRVLKTLLDEEYTEIQPQISPDGSWMAYASSESGRLEIYVRPFPDVDAGKWQISTGGGNSPLWSPDGTELFYIVDDKFMVVPLETEPAFKPGKLEVLFSGPYVSGVGEGTPWDIHPDGDRFLMMKESGSGATGGGPRRINVFLNWDVELKQRVPKE